MRVILDTFDREPYSSAVRPCLALLRRFWPGFSGWPLSVIWNERAVDFGPDAPLLITGQDQRWGRMLSAALSQVRDEWIFLWREDYLALRTFDSERLATMAGAIAAVPMAGYLRLVPVPPGRPAADAGYDEAAFPDDYRCSLQPAFWRREYLARICARYATPWDFELTERGSPDVGHYVYPNAVLSPVHFTQGLRRGTWQDEAIALCRTEGIVCPEPA